MLNELIEELIRKQLRQYDQMTLAVAEIPQSIEQPSTRHEICRPLVGHRSNGNHVAIRSGEKQAARRTKVSQSL